MTRLLMLLLTPLTYAALELHATSVYDISHWPTTGWGEGLGGSAFVTMRRSLGTELFFGGGYEKNQTSALMHYQLGTRYYLGRALFFQIGVYYKTVVQAANPPTGQQYGATGGVGLKVPLAKKITLVLHPQLQYGAQNLSTSTSTYRPLELMVFAGVAIGSHTY